MKRIKVLVSENFIVDWIGFEKTTTSVSVRLSPPVISRLAIAPWGEHIAIVRCFFCDRWFVNPDMKTILPCPCERKAFKWSKVYQ